MPSASSRSVAPALTLFVPHLLWPEPAQDFVFADLALPALGDLLGRAASTRQATVDVETALAAQFPDSGRPLAALRRSGEESSSADSGHWLCADPAHLRLHQEHIVLADANELALGADEVARLIADLNRSFADLGEFSAPHPQRWYLRCAQPLPTGQTAALPPLSAAAGRTLAASLPQDSAAAPLRQWLNEMQMFLHAHPVNAAREAAGRPTLNALWLWGAQTAQGSPHASVTEVFGTAPLLRGLAQAASCTLQTLPERFAGTTFTGHALIHLDALQAAALYEDADAWRRALLRLESDWFAPLAEALAAGRLRRLDIVAPCAHGLWRWQQQAPTLWRKIARRFQTALQPPFLHSRPRPYADWLRNLA